MISPFSMSGLFRACKYCGLPAITVFIEPIYDLRYGVCAKHLAQAQLDLEFKAYKDYGIPPRVSQTNPA